MVRLIPSQKLDFPLSWLITSEMYPWSWNFRFERKVRGTSTSPSLQFYLASQFLGGPVPTLSEACALHCLLSAWFVIYVPFPSCSRKHCRLEVRHHSQLPILTSELKRNAPLACLISFLITGMNLFLNPAGSKPFLRKDHCENTFLIRGACWGRRCSKCKSTQINSVFRKIIFDGANVQTVHNLLLFIPRWEKKWENNTREQSTHSHHRSGTNNLVRVMMRSQNERADR